MYVIVVMQKGLIFCLMSTFDFLSDVDLLSDGKNGFFHCPDLSNELNSSHYKDTWESCVAYLVFKVFWLISKIWVHQMLINVMGCIPLIWGMERF